MLESGSMPKSLWLLSLLLAANGCLLNAGTVTIDPGQFAQYTFVSNAPSFGCFPTFATASTCDTLLLLVPFVSPDPDNLTTELFNGSTLLDSYSSVCCTIAFRSPSSLFGYGSVVDFTSIQNGSIEGVIDVSSSQPFAISTDTVATLYLGNATSYCCTSDWSLSATLTGTYLTPEPPRDATITLLAFIACFGFRWFARRRAIS
jgi:hypothetical protein